MVFHDIRFPKNKISETEIANNKKYIAQKILLLFPVIYIPYLMPDTLTSRREREREGGGGRRNFFLKPSI